MKKLLNLLSVLTISGTAVPTTIAASPYQKEEQQSKLETNKIRVKRELKKIINNKNIEILHGDNIYKSLNNNKILVDYNNNLYFRSGTNNYVWILKNGETSFKKYDKVVDVLGFVIDSRNNIYFSTKTGDFVLKNGETDLVKITGVEKKLVHNTIKVDSEDNVYFGTNNGIYKLKYGDLKANKIMSINFDISFEGIAIDKQDNLYFASKNIIYLLEKNQTIVKKILEVENDNNEFDLLNIDNTNNLYFRSGTNNDVWILKNGETIAKKILYKINNGFFIRENNVYLLATDGLYVLNENKDKFEKIDGINQNIWSLSIDYNNNIYLATSKHGILKIKNNINNIVNLNNLINTSLVLYYQDKFNSDDNYLKEIKNVNINNLIYSNVLITKNIDPIINENNENICSGKTILENNLPTEQKLKTSNCKYIIQEIKSFQITTGLSKTTESQTNSEISYGFASSSSSSRGSQTGHSQTNSSSNSWEASGNAGFNFFGLISIGGSGGGGGQTASISEINSSTMYSSTQEISKSFNNSFSKSISLSNSFDLGNSQEKQSIKVFELELPFQELNVEGNQTIEVSTFLDKVSAQITLNLKQNINGEVNVKIINNKNQIKWLNISIKELMQKLEQYNILPKEIIINNDDTVTFNGKANFLYETSTIAKTSIREIETF